MSQASRRAGPAGIRQDRLERALNPTSVAVVGDKAAMGYLWLRNMKTFQGPLYSVQVDPKEVPGIEALGVPNYASLNDVPGDVDYVVCAVPRQVAPRIVADCARKGVGGVALFTSGFAETGEEEGIRLQNEITRIAKEAGLVLIGPNCMGLYNPRLGVRQSADQPAGDDGDVGFISQSGTHAINFSLLASSQGAPISKGVSMGNAVVINESDYLEYLARDPETRVIAMYVEGTKDGRRFFRTLREAAARKPTVVWKGGQATAGQRGAASHTASLAAESRVWLAAVRQAGAAATDTMDETVDVVKVFLHARSGSGRRMGLLAMTGGQSVVIADAFEREGLEVPLLTAASYEKLASFFNIIGGSYRNPFDIGGTIGWGGSLENLQRVLDILDGDEHIDAIAMEMASGFMARRFRDAPEALDRLLDGLVAFRDRTSKPFVTIMHPGNQEALVAELRSRVVERGLASFASFERAARAVAKVAAYWGWRETPDGELAQRTT